MTVELSFCITYIYTQAVPERIFLEFTTRTNRMLTALEISQNSVLQSFHTVDLDASWLSTIFLNFTTGARAVCSLPLMSGHVVLMYPRCATHTNSRTHMHTHTHVHTHMYHSFTHAHVCVLIATDVCARGLDVVQVCDTRTNTHTRTRTHEHAHTNTHTRTCTCFTLSRTHTRVCSLPLISGHVVIMALRCRTHTCTHIRTHTHAYANTHVRSHTRAHMSLRCATHTHTHTHT